MGEGVGPKTYAALIKAYAHRLQFDAIPPLLRRAKLGGVVFEANSLGHMIEAFVNGGRNEKATQLFKEAEEGVAISATLVIQHLVNCSIQKRWQEILQVCTKYRHLFAVDSTPRMPRQKNLVRILLDILADNPTEKGMTFTCQALDDCDSGLASACSNLLRNPSNKVWEACFEVLIRYRAIDTSGAHEVIQALSRSLWALGRRSDAVKLVGEVK